MKSAVSQDRGKYETSDSIISETQPTLRWGHWLAFKSQRIVVGEATLKMVSRRSDT